MAEKPEPVVVPIKNGWHAGSAVLNITVRGDSPEDARQRFDVAVRKAAELRAKSEDGGKTPAEMG
jgi:hypothetical protein